MFRLTLLALLTMSPALAQDPAAQPEPAAPDVSDEPGATDPSPEPTDPNPAPTAPSVEPTPPLQAARPVTREVVLERTPRPIRLLHLTYGTQATTAPLWRASHDRDAATTYGLAGGIELSDHLVVLGDYSFFQSSGLFEDASNQLKTRTTGHQLGAGLRVQAPYDDILVPYAQASLLGFLGRVSLDDQPDRPSDTVGATGISAGARAVAGVEFIVPVRADIQPALSLELGYGGVLRHPYSVRDSEGARQPIGSFSMSGLTARIALGARF